MSADGSVPRNVGRAGEVSNAGPPPRGQSPSVTEEILDGLGEGFAAVDSAWRVTTFNRIAEEASNLTRSQVLGRSLWELWPEIRGTEIEQRFRAVMAERKPQRFESPEVNPTGRYFEIRAFPVADGIGIAFRDATSGQATLGRLHERERELARAERQASTSEERLQGITDALPMLISYVDADQIFRFVNHTYEVWFERPRSAILGQRVDAVMSPAMYEARRPYLEKALRGEAVTYEADFPRSTGNAATEVVHVPHRDASGAVTGVYVVVTDISRRKTEERKLAESEARFRNIANSAPVPIWVTARGGLRAFVNDAYMKFLGVSYAEALVFDWRNALHPDDLPRISQEQVEKEASLQPFMLEARYHRGDGEWRWVRSESQPKWGPDGEHDGFIGVAHDVTDAKRAEEELTRLNETLERRMAERTAELAASEALVGTFFEHSPELHAVLVEDGCGFRFQAANPATLKLYGLPRDRIVGRRTEEALGAEAGADVNRHLAACLREGGTYRYERTHSGYVLEAVATGVAGGEGAPRRVVVSARDVTEQRRLEEQLRQALKMEAMGQLTGGVAHDFNNMLTLMLGGLDTIDRQLGQFPESPAKARILRAKDMALQGVQRARALTGHLLAFSRRQALAPQSLDANALVRNLCDLLQRTLGEPIALTTMLAPDLWSAFVDPNQLENALINLALNARDAMPRGGQLVIETANRVLGPEHVAGLAERVEPGDYVMIAVIDTGLGMDNETLARAFDPFFTTKEVGKGTGLGLSQVYGFTRQSGGSVEIESEPGRGATLRLYLPRQIAGAPQAAMVETPAELSRPGGRESILVVEDDDSVRAYATETLRELGYRVVEASSGRGALELIDTAPPLDLLLTDVVMAGDYNGRELADEATRRRPGLKVLYMTGYSRDAIVRHGRLAPGVHVIGKPFSLEELAYKIRKRLDAFE